MFDSKDHILDSGGRRVRSSRRRRRPRGLLLVPLWLLASAEVAAAVPAIVKELRSSSPALAPSSEDVMSDPESSDQSLPENSSIEVEPLEEMLVPVESEETPQQQQQQRAWGQTLKDAPETVERDSTLTNEANVNLAFVTEPSVLEETSPADTTPTLTTSNLAFVTSSSSPLSEPETLIESAPLLDSNPEKATLSDSLNSVPKTISSNLESSTVDSSRSFIHYNRPYHTPPINQPTSDHSNHRYYHRSNSNRMGPPDGFLLAARVYNDPHTKLAYFDATDFSVGGESNKPNPVVLPYWNCGVSGSTTSPLQLQRGYFRHSLGHTAWRGNAHLLHHLNSTSASDDDTRFDGNYLELNDDFVMASSRHSVLAVALEPLTIKLTSGESRDFNAGDVILLDDVYNPGHCIMGRQHSVPLSAPSAADQEDPDVGANQSSTPHDLPLVTMNEDVAVLFLTLPHPYPHGVDGRKYVSILEQQSQFRSRNRQNDHPCPTRDEDWNVHQGTPNARQERAATNKILYSLQDEETLYVSSLPWQKQHTMLRRAVLGILGLSLTTLLADFLAKTTPLWLAVGIGGTCLVAGGTVGAIVTGEYVYAWMIEWYWRNKENQQRQQLRSAQQYPKNPESDMAI
jgi:hypothetical protein